MVQAVAGERNIFTTTASDNTTWYIRRMLFFFTSTLRVLLILMPFEIPPLSLAATCDHTVKQETGTERAV
jgi:hypothetical protein